MTPNNPIKLQGRDIVAPDKWLIRNSRITWGSFLVYIAPLLLGMTLPGENISDPQGWLVGFWRYPFVLFIVSLQLVSFAVGWLVVSGVFLKLLSAIYIPVMGFWLGRNYFFGIEVNWINCLRLFLLCFIPTILIEGITRTRRRLRQLQRKD